MKRTKAKKSSEGSDARRRRCPVAGEPVPSVVVVSGEGVVVDSLIGGVALIGGVGSVGGGESMVACGQEAVRRARAAAGTTS
jgi:hypothetical protein